jgi:hypothetical protein
VGPADYSFRLIDVSAQPAVTPRADVSGSLSPGVRADVYRFEGAAGQRLYFDNRSGFNPSDSSSRWALYGPDDRQYGAGYLVYPTTSTDFELTLPMTGRYTLVAQGENAAATVNYAFRIIDLAADASPITVGAITDGVLSPGTATAVYRINSNPGQRLMFDGLQRDSDSVSARLLAPDGGVVFQIDPDGDTGPFTLTEAGPYYLMLHGNEQAAAADFSFRLLDVSAQAPAPLGTEISGSIDPGVGSAIYRIAGAAGQRLLFESLSGDNGGNWALYSVDNCVIFNRNLAESGNVLFGADGDYVLVFMGNNRNAEVNYKFRLTQV